MDSRASEPGDDRALDERLRAGGVRLATRSLDRPRVVVKPRPAWLARLLTLLRARAWNAGRLSQAQSRSITECLKRRKRS
jgi:hypothetical protein